jgi:RecA-family ATPase
MRQVDLTIAERFLAILDDAADTFHFRTLGAGRPRNHAGSLDDVAAALELENNKGAGVYVVVNEGGQDAASITRVRAVFADCDTVGASWPNCALEPHVIVETSPGKWHAYWLVDGLSLGDFERVQRAIAARYGTDPTVHDLPRIMRLPGFYHTKSDPYLCTIIHESGAQPYAAEQILAEFPTVTVTVTRDAARAELGEVVEVDRHAAILKETLLLAASVEGGHMTRGEALDVMRQRVASGRYTRDVPDDELVRALDGALRKRMGEAAPVDSPVKLGAVSLADVMQADDVEWPHVMDYYLPRRVVTLLGGHGGVGKSMLALVIAAHVAAGRPWGPLTVTQSRAVFLSFEDEGEIVRRRLRRVIETYQLPAADVIANLSVFDGSDADAELAVEGSGGAVLQFTPMMGVVTETVRGAGLIVVDNASDTYGASENERRQVKRFIRRLSDDAQANHAAMILLAHVDKQAAKGSGKGNNYSGSTQWHNGSRSRLALVESDEDGIQLLHEKANYGPRHEPIALQRLQHGVLSPIAPAEAAATREQTRHLTASADAEALLKVFEALIAGGVEIPTAETGQRTTYHVLSLAPEMPEHLKRHGGKERAKAAVMALERSGRLCRESYRRDSKERQRWALAYMPAQEAA